MVLESFESRLLLASDIMPELCYPVPFADTAALATEAARNHTIGNDRIDVFTHVLRPETAASAQTEEQYSAGTIDAFGTGLSEAARRDQSLFGPLAPIVAKSPSVETSDLLKGNESGQGDFFELSNSGPNVTLSIGDASIEEDGGVTLVTATLSQPSTEDVFVTLDYAGAAFEDEDFYARYVSGVIINATYIPEGAASSFAGGAIGGLGGAIPTTLVGGGNLDDVMNVAIEEWTSRLVANRTLDLTYTWQPRGTSNLGSALTATPSNSNFPTSSYIRISSDPIWFADATPIDDDEFSNYAEVQRDIGGGVLTAARNYTSASGDAVGLLDLYSTVVHEVGHALGWTPNGNFADPLVLRSDLPFAGSSIETTLGGGGHIDPNFQSNALMDPFAEGPGRRTLIGDLDHLGLAQITGDDVNLFPKTQIVIPAGQSSASMRIRAIDDVLFESDEVVTISIDTVVGGMESGNQQVDLTIIDDDDPDIADYGDAPLPYPVTFLDDGARHATSASAWLQTGGDILGEATEDFSGRGTAMSGDGTTIALGTNLNDGGGAASGHVRVLRFDATTSSWVQIGADIDGEALGDESGNALSLSVDGNILAVGATRNDGSAANGGHVRVFQYDEATNAWTQIGSDLDGTSTFAEFGVSLSLSSDGQTLAIGASGGGNPSSRAGFAQVYTFDAALSNWVQLGSTISGEAAGDDSGQAVVISGDGQVIGIGAYGNDAGGSNSGHVRLFEYDATTGDWSQLGSDIDGNSAGDNFGFRIALSEDGKTVAAGAWLNDDGGADAGQVRVFEFDNTTSQWTQKGSAVSGTNTGERFGFGVSLSADGNVFAAGSIFDDSVANDAGRARAFEFDATTGDWAQKGATLTGSAPTDNFGQGVVLSDDGQTLLASSPGSDVGGSNLGKAQVFQFGDNLRLGITKDIETDGVPSASADSDGSDEDGVIISQLVTSESNDIGVIVTGDNGRLDAWIDFNADGDWDDAGEQVFSDLPVVAGQQILSVTVPASAVVGTTFARFRLSSQGNLAPLGRANDGEVEDYQVSIVNPTPVAFGDSASTSPNSPVDISVLANDEPANEIQIVDISQPSNGTVSFDVNGLVTYTPDPGFSGTDTFEYTIALENSELVSSAASVGDRFGRSVAISGDLAVVGAYLDDPNGITNAGSAFVYERTGDTSWVQVAQLNGDLNADDAQSYFGWSVAIDGDTIAVGAQFDRDNGFRSGAVYVFDRDAGGIDNWGRVAKFSGDDTDNSDYFSRSLAIEGDTIVVGASISASLGSASGAAYVFQRDQGGADNFGQVKKLLGSTQGAGDRFGQAVAISGDTIAVGAFQNDTLANNAGAVFLFNRNMGGASNWGEQAVLYPGGGVANDFFGYSVDLDGESLAIGSPLSDVPGKNQVGAIYLHGRNVGGSNIWGQVERLEAENSVAGDRLGWSVGISGERVVGGAIQSDIGGNQSGAAYLFEFDGGGWSQSRELQDSQVTTADEYGVSIAIDGEHAVVGSWLDNRPFNNTGGAYVLGLRTDKAVVTVNVAAGSPPASNIALPDSSSEEEWIAILVNQSNANRIVTDGLRGTGRDPDTENLALERESVDTGATEAETVRLAASLQRSVAQFPAPRDQAFAIRNGVDAEGNRLWWLDEALDEPFVEEFLANGMGRQL